MWREIGRPTPGKCRQGEDRVRSVRSRGLVWSSGRIGSRGPFSEPWGRREGGRVGRKSAYELRYEALDNFLVAGKAEVAPGLHLLQESFLHQFVNHLFLQHLVGE